MIDKNNSIFIYQTEDIFISPERKAYFGSNSTHQNPLDNLYSYIIGYRHSIDGIYQNFSDSGRDRCIDIQDTIIYPLMFCHRHCVELELKYLSGTYCRTDDEIKQVLQQGHNLSKIWNHIYPHVKKRAERIGYSINFEAISHYIQEISQVDGESFTYRYPMNKKDLSPTIGRLIELDVLNMHNRLNDFHEYLMRITYHLNSQLDYLEYDKSFAKQFKSELQSNLSEIEKVLSHQYDNDSEEPAENGVCLWQFKHYDPKKDHELIYCSNLSKEIKRILIILHFSKKYIENSHLAVKKEDRLKDIFRILHIESKNVHIEDYDYIYISSKLKLILKHAYWYRKIIEEIINH